MGSGALRISFTGACTVAALDDPERELPVLTNQARLVLARLALSQSPVAQDDLADLLWSDTLPASWERHLSAVVSKLRRLLRTATKGDAASIAGRTGFYQLKLPPGSVIDVLEATSAARRARQLVGEAQLDEAWAMASTAAGVVRRPFLPGSEATWVDEQRESLRTLLVQALGVLVEIAVLRREPAGLGPAREAVSLDAYREAGYRDLMRLHLGLGERAAASVVYERCREMLNEVDLSPSEELEELRRAAVQGSAVSMEAVGVSSVQAVRAGTALPVADTSFVGRKGALDAVAAALGRSRLVTLIGTGGVGKSRLALESAHRLAHRHRDGARLCELAYVADSHGVPFAIAVAVGVHQRHGATIEESLVDALTVRDLLVVVDNCEHVLDAVVPLLERIVRYCPRVRLLATSRERLAADGESMLEVTPLAVPSEHTDPEAAWDRPAAALQLLRDRIAGIRRDFRPDASQRAALADIARHLDGLPLALELAAARIASLGPVEVAGRLDQRFNLLTRGLRTALSRHRTLRAAVEWSYDLLDDAEKRVFERCTVFLGGFTMGAAEDVCAAGGVRSEDVADIIAALVDKSMLTIDDRGPRTRYRMLETLREFGHECLAARGEITSTEQAHALHYTALAWQAEVQLRGPAEPEWVPIVEAELGNLRAAHAWGLRSGNRNVAAELSAALFLFAHWRTRTEVLGWADQLADDEPGEAVPHFAEAVAAAGDAAWMRGDLVRARALGERAVSVAGGDTAARFGWHVLGAVANFEGRLDDCVAAFRRVEELALRVDNHYHATDALGTMAMVLAYSGDTSTAIATAQASRDEAARSGSPSALAWAAYATGEVLSATDPDEALTYLDHAVDLADSVGAHFIRGVAMLTATSLRARHGDLATGARAVARIIDHWEQAGNWRQQWITLRSAVELLARLGKEQAAATLVGAIDAHDAANVFGADAVRLNRIRDSLRGRLGTDFDSYAADGGEMEPIDVVAFSRRELEANVTSG